MKAVILIGGPLKGTRFRPLSFDLPKPLFPVAGRPMVQHLIEACAGVSKVREILLIGFYQLDEMLVQFMDEMTKQYSVPVKYLQEYTSLGTGGGIYHFRDQIRRGNVDGNFFLINGDVCGEFPLNEMLEFHKRGNKLMTIMAIEATRQQSLNYGCIVEDESTNSVLHYVEKPSTFVSTTINCGVYICESGVFDHLAEAYQSRQDVNSDDDNVVASISTDLSNGYHERQSYVKTEAISLEHDILASLAGANLLFTYHTNRWWSRIKTAASVIYANRHYLELLRKTAPDSLFRGKSEGPKIIGDVFIHETAVVDPSSTLGPNVSIGPGVKIGRGVRIRESIILGCSTICDHSLVRHSIVGWKSLIGLWTRVEGTPSDPDPNKPFAKMENQTLFNSEGKLNPSITVLGSNVQVPSEVIVLNSIVLPHKELARSYRNEIIL